MSDFLRKYILRDLYQPHPWWGFDGPYTRLQMDDGSSFIFIMSSVWKAKTNPYLCHVSYAPLPSMTADLTNEIAGFAKDWYPNAMGITRRKQGDQDGISSFAQTAFVPEESSVFKLDVTARKQAYHHWFPHPLTGKPMHVEVDIRDNTPHSLCGPMWLARFMPIPLKWHVFSTRSRATVTISDENKKVLLKKAGLAHQEKNWGIGFPSAWIWCQGFCTPADRGSLAIAGGQVTSFLRAFMLAYRSPISHRNWDFGPASTMQLFGWGPFCKMTKCESEKGEVELVCTNWLNGRRIKVLGSGRPDTFQMMSAPLPRGHTPWYCHETFQATYQITLYEKPWFKAWQEVEHTIIENSALEFGGDWSHWWRQHNGSEKKDA